jgi:putative DeoR family transcriptional regulator (stage III sporulation protein D)
LFFILQGYAPGVKVAYRLSFLHKLSMAAHSIGGESMVSTIEDRVRQLAVYIIETGATVRAAARHFGISKSTVHKDLSQRLPQCNKRLYAQVRLVLDENKAQRHIRGGIATRKKYQKT